MSKFIDIENNDCLEVSFPKPAVNQVRQVELLAEVNKKSLISKYFELLNSGKIPFIINPHIPEKKITLESQDYPLGHILCTSGTTSEAGRIKSFFFSLEQAIENAEAHNRSLDIKKGANILFPLPFYHSFGVVVGLLGSQDRNLYFQQSPMGAMQIFKHLFQIDVLYLTPSLVRQMIKYAPRIKEPISQPKKISIGSSVLFEDEAFQLQQIFPEAELFYTYGLTEMGPRVSTHKLEQLKPIHRHLSLGAALSGINWEVRDKILYIDTPFACHDVARPFKTNDIVLNQNGDFIIQGRSDDTIIFQGKNIYPEEIESILPYSCALIGIPHQLYGEVPFLIVEEEIADHIIWDLLAAKFPQDYLPKKILTGENIPKTSMGKIKRRELAKRYM